MAPSPADSRPTRAILVPLVRDVFRRHGYDGATLTALAKATNLGRGTLYHHFPGGKDEMADAALADVENVVADLVAALHSGEGSAGQRLGDMMATLDDYYDGGRTGCLLAALALDRGDHQLGGRVAAAFAVWANGLADIARQSHLPDPERRAEDALVAIQGGLVLAAGLGDPGPFRRALGVAFRSLTPPEDAPILQLHSAPAWTRPHP